MIKQTLLFSLVSLVFSGCIEKQVIVKSDTKTPILKGIQKPSKALSDKPISKHLIKKIRSVIPNTKITYIERNQYVNDLYNAYIVDYQGNVEVFMINPFTNTFIIGEMISSSGDFLSTINKQNFRKKYAKKLHSKSIKKIKNKKLFTQEYMKQLLNLGVKFNTKEGDNKVILFVSTSCPHCVDLVQELDKQDIATYRYYSYSVEAVNLLNKKGVTDPKDHLRKQFELSKTLNIKGVPYMIVIDKDNNYIADKLGVSVDDIKSYKTSEKRKGKR